SLNEKYYGSQMSCDETIAYEWARIPHFYNAFYVYKYATGFSAAVQIAGDVLQGKNIEEYKKFLTTGGSDYPLNELKIAGVNLVEGGPVEACMVAFENTLAEFEKAFSN
ncbi:MAG: M3 family metallopeptidase, partial [Eubacteriales bacterium]